MATSESNPENPIVSCACGCGATFLEYDKWGYRRRWLSGHHGRRPLSDRFWAKVNKDGPIHPILGTACWPWAGAMVSGGYGHIGMGGQGYVAHRVSWELANGAIPDELFVLHKCDNPPCVRPEHLFLGTPLDNMRDMIAKGRDRYPTGKANFRPAIGENNGLSKLTERDVIEIRAIGRSRSQSDIAREYGVHQSLISLILSRRIWDHL